MNNQNRENLGLSRTCRKHVAVDAYTLNADLNRTLVETVLADLELALIFTDIAAARTACGMGPAGSQIPRR